MSMKREFKIKNIFHSLHDRVASGEITMRQAAEELCKAGWTCGFIDMEKTARLIGYYD